MFGCAGSSLLPSAHSGCGERGLFSSCDAWGFSLWGHVCVYLVISWSNFRLQLPMWFVFCIVPNQLGNLYKERLFTIISTCIGKTLTKKKKKINVSWWDHWRSLWWPLTLWNVGWVVTAPRLQNAGSAAMVPWPSFSNACGILLDQGSNLCLLHWQADSYPLYHQGIVASVLCFGVLAARHVGS